MKWIIKLLFFVFITNIISSCELFFPPAYYNEIVNKTGSSDSGGTTGRSWKTIGNAGFSATSTPSGIQIKIDFLGNPIVASYDVNTSNVYLDTFNGGWYDNYNNMGGSISGISFALSNQTIPFLFAANSSAGILYYSTNFLTNSVFNFIIAPPALAFSNNYPCVTYQSNNGNRYIQQWDGTTWSTPPTICSGSGGKTILSYDSNGSGAYYVVNVPVNSLTIDAANSLSGLSTARTNFTVVNAQISMTAQGGYAYLLYQDIALGLAILRIDPNGNTLPLGVIPGASPMSGNSIAAGNNGQLYAAESDGASFLIKVYMFSNAIWTQIGNDIGQGQNPSIDVGSDGTPFVAFSDNNAGNKITVKAFK